MNGAIPYIRDSATMARLVAVKQESRRDHDQPDLLTRQGRHGAQSSRTMGLENKTAAAGRI